MAQHGSICQYSKHTSVLSLPTPCSVNVVVQPCLWFQHLTSEHCNYKLLWGDLLTPHSPACYYCKGDHRWREEAIQSVSRDTLAWLMLLTHWSGCRDILQQSRRWGTLAVLEQAVTCRAVYKLYGGNDPTQELTKLSGLITYEHFEPSRAGRGPLEAAVLAYAALACCWC